MIPQIKNENSMKINQIVFLLCIVVLSFGKTTAQSKTIPVDHFEKITVSPHIQVDFIQGEQESVTIDDISVPMEKLNVEVKGKTLQIYLEGAKTVTKSEKVHDDNRNGKRSIYNGTIVKATISYKNLEELSLRGEEKFVCKSLLETDQFKLKAYGESEIYLNEVKFKSMDITIYGESYLEIKNGSIESQKITAYGESEINTLGVDNVSTKITAYGETEISLKVSKNLKVTAYGEATVKYKGSPNVDRGIIIGDTTIRQIQ